MAAGPWLHSSAAGPGCLRLRTVAEAPAAGTGGTGSRIRVPARLEIAAIDAPGGGPGQGHRDGLNSGRRVRVPD